MSDPDRQAGSYKRQKNREIRKAVKRHMDNVDIEVRHREFQVQLESAGTPTTSSCINSQATFYEHSTTSSCINSQATFYENLVSEPHSERPSPTDNNDNVGFSEWEQHFEINLESSSESEDDCQIDASTENEATSLKDFLLSWYFEQNVPKTAFTALLKGLRNWHTDLPSDARTLLETPKANALQDMGDGQYYNFGLESGIIKQLLNDDIDTSVIHTLHLNFNIDGLPLYKSSNKQFWPILCMVEEDPLKRPFVAYLFCGSSKPPIEHFMEDLVKEFSKLQQNGIYLAERRLNVVIRSFCCDTPAKAFVKCTKGHNGYSGCDRCCQRGEWLGRMTFPDTEAALRTDEAFHEMEDPDHHKGVSPLARLGVGLVSSFPLDYMHLCCLGVMRRLILTWKAGSRAHPGRLPARDLDRLNLFLVNARRYWPSEFNRQPRSLAEVDRFKATEFRSFLLYTGPVYLKGILSKELYGHFMMFFCAITILVSEDLHAELNDYAHELLKLFVSYASELYGHEFIVYNVHSLVHLASDAMRFGPLDTFSAFPFENFLQILKRMVRKTNQPLQQVCNRIKEQETYGFHTKKCIKKEFTVVETSKATNGKAPAGGVRGTHFSKVRSSAFKLSTHLKDCTVILDNAIIIKIGNVVTTESGKIYLVGQQYCKLEDFFVYPCASSRLSIYKVSNLSLAFQAFPISRFKQKAVLLPYKDVFVCIPMRHLE